MQPLEFCEPIKKEGQNTRYTKLLTALIISFMAYKTA